MGNSNQGTPRVKGLGFSPELGNRKNRIGIQWEYEDPGRYIPTKLLGSLFL